MLVYVAKELKNCESAHMPGKYVKTKRYNSNYTEGYVRTLNEIQGQSQLNYHNHGGADEGRPPILIIFNWRWPWISLWALTSTPLCNCCCIWLFYQNWDTLMVGLAPRAPC